MKIIAGILLITSTIFADRPNIIRPVPNQIEDTVIADQVDKNTELMLRQERLLHEISSKLNQLELIAKELSIQNTMIKNYIWNTTQRIEDYRFIE